MKLQGKTALITGAGSGLGRATADLFAAEGAQIVLAEIDPEKGAQAEAALRAAGCAAVFIQTDTAEETQVRAAVQETVDTFGALDILINNAGLGADHASWEKVIRVNAQGVYYGFKYGYETMLAGGGGTIVSMSTAFVVNDEADEATDILKQVMKEEPADWSDALHGCIQDAGAAYLTSKRMVNHFTRVFALEGAARGIRVNAVAPGFTRTEMARPLWEDEAVYRQHAAMMPMNRFAEQEEVARAVLFLASPDASYITGAVLPVDAGFSASQYLKTDDS